MSKWLVSSLHGKLHVKHGYPFKSEYFSDTGNYIVLTPGNFYEAGGFKRQSGKEKFYIGDIPKDYLHDKGDMIVAMTEQAEGLLGSCAFVPEDNLYLHNQRLGLITTDQKQLDRNFVYYLFQTKSVREQIRLTSSGSKVKHTSPERIYAVVAPLPKVEEQKKIAAVLSALDAKIDCNNRINAELEAMAKTLYDYWFVQFDFPDANGKPYKSSGGKMVYNPSLKREIPEGWNIGVAADLLDFNPSVNLKTGSEASYIDMNSLPVTGFMTDAPERKLFRGGSKFQNGDVVIARITPCLENGKTALITLLANDEAGFGSTEFIVMSGRRQPLISFAAQLSRTVSFRQFAISNMTGTSGRKRIDARTLETYSLPIPPTNVLSQYENTIGPVFKKMTINAKEYQQLTQHRDWLLPMLMNGQVTVK